MLLDNDEGSVIEVTGANGLKWSIMTTNGPASDTAKHHFVINGKNYDWTGNFAVEGIQ